jgi:hypothetical protein
MRRVMGVLAIACLLLCSGCIGHMPTAGGLKKASWDVEDPDQARERARILRAEAAGFTKDAREYEAVMRITREHLERHRMRIEALLKRQGELDERIDSIAEKSARASKAERTALEDVRTQFTYTSKALGAQIDQEKIRVLTLQQQLRSQRRLHDAYLWSAEQREADADLLEQYAVELSEGSW